MRKPVDRRQFVKTISAVGALGAIAPGAAAQAGQAGGAPEFQKPTNLRTGAQLDSRFPVSFAAPVTEGFRLVTEYFTALSQRNPTGNGKSKIMRGSYDLLEGANVHLYCPVGGACSLSFTRYTPNGHRLLVCDGLFPLHRRWTADFGNAERRDPDLQERPVGQRRRPRTGHASRQVELCRMNLRLKI